MLGAVAASAETIRVATWHVELTRDGPGLLLRDILRGDAPDVQAVVTTIAEIAPDVILLTGIDWDYDLAALAALADRIAAGGLDYPYRFALRPNSGLATGLDMDGDGRTGGPRDAQGYGLYSGHGGMALLSRYPVEADRVRDFSALLWADLPGATLPELDGNPFPSAEALAVQRLSSVGHWDVPIRLPSGASLNLLAFSATPPVFDGPEDRNGLRNRDEIAFWSAYLNGRLGPPPDGPVVVLGNANLDPLDGDGRNAAIAALIAHPRLQDPQPASKGAPPQTGANASHKGDAALDTADWPDEPGPGNLRVSYVLPDNALTVAAAGVVWPAKGAPLFDLLSTEGSPRHHMVWVDITLPD